MSELNKKILEHNVYELTEQLHTSYIRIKELNEKMHIKDMQVAAARFLLNDLLRKEYGDLRGRNIDADIKTAMLKLSAALELTNTE